MVQEAIDTGLAPPGELLIEVDVLLQVADGVVVSALNWGLGSQHVCQGSGMADFLISHELQQVHVLRIESKCFKVFLGKLINPIVE
mgnify:CR=1 FL=1